MEGPESFLTVRQETLFTSTYTHGSSDVPCSLRVLSLTHSLTSHINTKRKKKLLHVVKSLAGKILDMHDFQILQQRLNNNNNNNRSVSTLVLQGYVLTGLSRLSSSFFWSADFTGRLLASLQKAFAALSWQLFRNASTFADTSALFTNRSTRSAVARNGAGNGGKAFAITGRWWFLNCSQSRMRGVMCAVEPRMRGMP